jgi:hypothetical protein
MLMKPFTSTAKKNLRTKSQYFAWPARAYIKGLGNIPFVQRSVSAAYSC